MPSLAELMGMAPAQGTLAGLTMGGTGLAPYGLRHSGQAPKGKGFFGLLPNAAGGYSTELSTEFDFGGKIVEAPLMVPTLDAVELQHLLSGGAPTEAIYRKAYDFARSRIESGKGAFAGQNDLRLPRPAAVSGSRPANPGVRQKPPADIYGVRG